MKKQHAHEFVESYDGLVGFGLDRETDENTLMVYAQKFSEDTLISTLVKRMADEDLAVLFDTFNRLMTRYLSEAEYHRLFLKEDD